MEEIDPSRGTTYRKVLLHNADEEKLFHEVTEPANSAGDPVYMGRGRPIGLAKWAAQRLELLHTL